MAARRADLVGKFGAEDFGLHCRAIGTQRAFYQARVGLFVFAKRHDARNARLLRPPFQVSELRIVTIENCGAAGFEPKKDFRFGVRDLCRANRRIRDAPAQLS